jgi:protein ImuB
MSDRGYACVWTGAGRAGGAGRDILTKLADEFSPRYEVDGDRSITIDISGLGRLLGSFNAIGAEIVREASAQGLDAHVAVAGTCTAARILARTRPGLTVVPPGEEAAALAPLRVEAPATNFEFLSPHSQFPSVLSKWGIRTLGAFVALPAADIRARLGRQGALLQAIARGEDIRPLVPDQKDERFEATLDLEWPIEGLEPLSFVLTRLLEPLSTRLERRDRAAAALHVALGLVAGVAGDADADAQTRGDLHVRRLEFPTPLREVRTLRTLALIDMESHPPGGPIERVTVTIEPTPGRVLQHTLFSRSEPTPDEISTLLARLAALLGAGRIGSPVAVDSYRPGAFGMAAFGLQTPGSGQRIPNSQFPIPNSPDPRSPIPDPQSVLRRFRPPVPVRVTIEEGRPIRVAADRRGFGDSRIVSTAGPWRSSGEWWTHVWDHEEWDVAMADGAVYRVFRELGTGGWFLEAIVD